MALTGRMFGYVSRAEALEEAWFLGLRLNEGVSVAALEQEFGVVGAHQHDDEISDLITLGLLERDDRSREAHLAWAVDVERGL